MKRKIDFFKSLHLKLVFWTSEPLETLALHTILRESRSYFAILEVQSIYGSKMTKLQETFAISTDKTHSVLFHSRNFLFH